MLLTRLCRVISPKNSKISLETLGNMTRELKQRRGCTRFSRSPSPVAPSTMSTRFRLLIREEARQALSKERRLMRMLKLTGKSTKIFPYLTPNSGPAHTELSSWADMAEARWLSRSSDKKWPRSSTSHCCPKFFSRICTTSVFHSLVRVSSPTFASFASMRPSEACARF
eukprot:32640_1